MKTNFVFTDIIIILKMSQENVSDIEPEPSKWTETADALNSSSSSLEVEDCPPTPEHMPPGGRREVCQHLTNVFQDPKLRPQPPAPPEGKITRSPARGEPSPWMEALPRLTGTSCVPSAWGSWTTSP